MTLKGRLRLYAWTVWGFLLFIGHVTPWGRTNWWPQTAPCFVPAAHKGIGVQLHGGQGVQGSGYGDEQVSHRIAGLDELELGRWRSMGWGFVPHYVAREHDTLVHSPTLSFTRSHIHTLSRGFWCQLLASSSLNDPRLTHIISHV